MSDDAGTLAPTQLLVWLRMTLLSALEMARGSTVTVNELVPVLPTLSVAVTVTGVAPIGKVEPDGMELVVGALPLTTSTADVVKLTTAPAAPVASTNRLPGVVMTGGAVSATVTTNVPVPELPAPSVAVTTTVAAPKPKTWPEGGTQETGTEPLTISYAAGV